MVKPTLPGIPSGVPPDMGEADDKRNAALITGVLNARSWPGPTNGSQLPAPSSAAEEPVAAVGLDPRHVHSGRHLEPFQDLSRSGIHSPQFALVTFPGAVPQLAIDPGDPGDEAVGFDGAKERPCLGIDLMDLPVPILSHPERPFGPGEPRATAAQAVTCLPGISPMLRGNWSAQRRSRF